MIYNGDTALCKRGEERDPAAGLARFRVKVLGVEGSLLVSGVIKAKAFLEDCVLEDSRVHADNPNVNASSSDVSSPESESEAGGAGTEEREHERQTSWCMDFVGLPGKLPA